LTKVHTELELTNMQAYIGGAKCTVAHTTELFGAMAHPTHHAAPHSLVAAVSVLVSDRAGENYRWET